jgi:hypothetical protein
MIQIVVCRLPVYRLPPARQEEGLFTVWPGVAAESGFASPYNYVCLSPDKRPGTFSHAQPLFQLVVGRWDPTLARSESVPVGSTWGGGAGVEERGEPGRRPVLQEAVTEGPL